MPSHKTRLQMSGGSADAYFTWPDGQGPWPGVLLWMDAIGWRPVMFEMADRIAAAGYCVLVPHVFWREGEPRVFDLKQMMNPGPLLEEVMKLIASMNEEVVTRDAAVYLDFLAAQPQVSEKSRLATTGYCMGGGLSLCTAWALPERVAVALSFHGGGHVTSPEAPGRIAARTRARVYLAVAEVDRRHNAEVTQKLEAALREAKVPHQIELYAGTSHGFAVTDHVVFNAAAAERHWEATLRVLRETYAR
jgi:carboxymethylenebutenolidase